ncbi:MAG: DUF3179 domain-containing protein [Anaerolineales bacterium]|nr:DUF3179 domain-containing protein [Anaerolineales bacterium]
MVLSRSVKTSIFLAGLGLVLAACTSVVTDELDPTPTNVPTPTDVDGDEILTPTPEDTSDEVDDPDRKDPFEGIRLRFNPAYWPNTDFNKHSVDYSEIFSGGPPPDGIPAIDSPEFESVEESDRWLQEDWPVMFFELNGEARAYPLVILIYHEIVNDVVGDEPVALTFCPLCNSTIAFDRTLDDGRVLDFGTTGNLRNSDLVMYDRQTQSWWQQFTGEAIVGELTGTSLTILPSQIIAWSDFKESFPDGSVLSRNTGHFRPYGQNPYSGYDTIDSNPFFPVEGEDDRLLPKERVVAIELDDQEVAYPFSFLGEVQVVNDVIEETPIVVFWKGGTVSGLGNEGQEIGSTGVFERDLDGQELTFVIQDGEFFDEQTGSTWNILGESIEGPLTGQSLERVVSAEHFWFAWAAFKPDTIVRGL